MKYVLFCFVAGDQRVNVNFGLMLTRGNASYVQMKLLNEEEHFKLTLHLRQRRSQWPAATSASCDAIVGVDRLNEFSLASLGVIGCFLTAASLTLRHFCSITCFTLSNSLFSLTLPPSRSDCLTAGNSVVVTKSQIFDADLLSRSLRECVNNTSSHLSFAQFIKVLLVVVTEGHFLLCVRAVISGAFVIWTWAAIGKSSIGSSVNAERCQT